MKISKYKNKEKSVKKYLEDNKDKVLSFKVKHGWLTPQRDAKVIDLYDTYARVGILDKNGNTMYHECINYSALILKDDKIAAQKNASDQISLDDINKVIDGLSTLPKFPNYIKVTSSFLDKLETSEIEFKEPDSNFGFLGRFDGIKILIDETVDNYELVYE